jgi:hypothetical protein
VPDNTPLLGLVLAAGGVVTILWVVTRQIAAARIQRENDEALEARKTADREAAARAADETDDGR